MNDISDTKNTVWAARGAIQVSEDSIEKLQAAVIRLTSELMRRNHIAESDIISVIFSQTSDISSANPATALRQIGFSHIPLFCAQEPQYPNSLPYTIRILITYRSTPKHTPHMLYLDGASILRCDLAISKNEDSDSAPTIKA